MNKVYIALLAILYLYASLTFAEDYAVVKPETVGLSSARLKHMDVLIDKHVAEKKIGGAVVLVARKGKIAYLRESGSADVGKPMKKDTIFRIVSISRINGDADTGTDLAGLLLNKKRLRECLNNIFGN